METMLQMWRCSTDLVNGVIPTDWQYLSWNILFRALHPLLLDFPSLHAISLPYHSLEQGWLKTMIRLVGKWFIDVCSLAWTLLALLAPMLLLGSGRTSGKSYLCQNMLHFGLKWKNYNVPGFTCWPPPWAGLLLAFCTRGCLRWVCNEIDCSEFSHTVKLILYCWCRIDVSSHAKYMTCVTFCSQRLFPQLETTPIHLCWRRWDRNHWLPAHKVNINPDMVTVW